MTDASARVVSPRRVRWVGFVLGVLAGCGTPAQTETAGELHAADNGNPEEIEPFVVDAAATVGADASMLSELVETAKSLEQEDVQGVQFRPPRSPGEFDCRTSFPRSFLSFVSVAARVGDADRLNFDFPVPSQVTAFTPYQSLTRLGAYPPQYGEPAGVNAVIHICSFTDEAAEVGLTHRYGRVRPRIVLTSEAVLTGRFTGTRRPATPDTPLGPQTAVAGLTNEVANENRVYSLRPAHAVVRYDAEEGVVSDSTFVTLGQEKKDTRLVVFDDLATLGKLPLAETDPRLSTRLKDERLRKARLFKVSMGPASAGPDVTDSESCTSGTNDAEPRLVMPALYVLVLPSGSK